MILKPFRKGLRSSGRFQRILISNILIWFRREIIQEPKAIIFPIQINCFGVGHVCADNVQKTMSMDSQPIFNNIYNIFHLQKVVLFKEM